MQSASFSSNFLACSSVLSASPSAMGYQMLTSIFLALSSLQEVSRHATGSGKSAGEMKSRSCLARCFLPALLSPPRNAKITKEPKSKGRRYTFQEILEEKAFSGVRRGRSKSSCLAARRAGWGWGMRLEKSSFAVVSGFGVSPGQMTTRISCATAACPALLVTIFNETEARVTQTSAHSFQLVTLKTVPQASVTLEAVIGKIDFIFS